MKKLHNLVTVVLLIFLGSTVFSFSLDFFVPAKKATSLSNQVKQSVPISSIPNSADAKDNRCIIVIDSVQYDVTEFRNIHDGGDIFECGTDMSSVFNTKHGASHLNALQKYKLFQ